MPWSLALLLDICAMPKVFSWSWHCSLVCGWNFPGELWRSISRRKAGVWILVCFFLASFNPTWWFTHFVSTLQHSFRYNPNCWWTNPSWPMFFPRVSTLTATTTGSTWAGTFWMDWEDWQFIMGQKLGSDQRSELVRKFIDSKRTCAIMYLNTYIYICIHIYFFYWFNTRACVFYTYTYMYLCVCGISNYSQNQPLMVSGGNHCRIGGFSCKINAGYQDEPHEDRAQEESHG